jgi:hypothetical protein
MVPFHETVSPKTWLSLPIVPDVCQRWKLRGQGQLAGKRPIRGIDEPHSERMVGYTEVTLMMARNSPLAN